MSTPRPAGPYPIPGATMPTWLIRFDETGQCVSPGTAQALLNHLGQNAYTDVLFYSHGWNTDFADAVDQYSRFLIAFADVVGRFPIAGFKPIFVGVTWPSVWLANNAGPVMAGAGDVSASVVTAIASALAPADRERLYALTDAQSLSQAEAAELAGLMAPAMGKTPEEVDGEAAVALKPEEIVAIAVSIAESERKPVFGGTDDFDITGPDAQIAGAASDFIDPRNLIRLFSLFQMKDRAGKVGANGVAKLLRQLQSATQANIRVFGHSFGCKVMLSAICAPAPLPRKVSSLLLLEPAISYLSLAKTVPGRSGPGGYRAALSLVAGRIFSTFSKMDQPLHDVFHLALRRPGDLGEAQIAEAGEPPSRYAALGGYGPRQSDEQLVDPIPAPGVAYAVPPSVRLLGLDGSSGRITSHGDVANGYTAWALRQLIVDDIV